MGYTIGMRCRNVKLQWMMAAFMEANYRGWSKVPGSRQQDDYSRFASNRYAEDSRLSYDHARNALGFDFNACEPERDYIFAVTRWMALKVGAKRKFKGLGLMPFYVYDGGHSADERWPILLRGEWEEKVPEKWRWCLTHANGFRTMLDRYVGTPVYEEYRKKGKLNDFIKNHFSMLKEIYKSYSAADKLINAELDRLDKLWADGRWHGSVEG